MNRTRVSLPFLSKSSSESEKKNIFGHNARERVEFALDIVDFFVSRLCQDARVTGQFGKQANSKHLD